MLKIVLMDDEYYFRQAMKKYLSEIGTEYEVVGEAKNGEEGLALIEELTPDIAFVDINMPIMNGIQMTEELARKKSKCKIIMVTGYNEFEYARKAMKLGVQDYILKPVDIQELEDCLERVVAMIEEEKQIQMQYREWERVKESMNDQYAFSFPEKMDYLSELQNMEKKQVRLPEKVAEYIEQNCGKYDLSLEGIARTFAVSRTALCQQFKETKSMTIGEYIHQTRMIKAKELLELGFQNISFISEKCGYDSAGYFSKCFKKYYGVSPSEYIKLLEMKKND